ncbi:MAG TPA: thioredoxin domain-containing protein [Humibacter sp.]|nr:thioredoxin domain-containing protein [Humibacter sp.]
MPNRLANAISPYLRAHADNPVDWWPWGADAFAEAERRDVPLLISIGYATCHWCHVMARESFADPALAEALNRRFVAVKVDREEHPDVDASYLAAASAFTRNLGWPLTVFATPRGRTFFAGTYFPAEPRADLPSFRQVLDAVTEAWTQRRSQVDDTAAHVAAALKASTPAVAEALPGDDALAVAVGDIVASEDQTFGGFGRAPKFPVAPVLAFLLRRSDGAELARRTLARMASSPLRDPVDGGFFRYATQRDWSQPHYERMLYDNALLLRCYAGAAVSGHGSGERQPQDPDAEAGFAAVAEGVAGFLLGTMRVAGGFASAQDSESTVAGVRVEGGYYALDADARGAEVPPGRDEKVLTGWNGLAMGALAHAGLVLGRPDWVETAATVADELLAAHLRSDGSLVRARLGAGDSGRTSAAPATLEDYGMLAGGLLDVLAATGEPRFAVAARGLIDAVLAPQGGFAVPGGPDAVLADRGLAIAGDPSEGAYPSGLSAAGHAAHRLYELAGDARYDEAARGAARSLASAALSAPISFGAALDLAAALDAGPTQLVVVLPRSEGALDVPLAREASRWTPGAELCVVTDAQASSLSAAGFDLFTSRTCRDGRPTAYLCRDFVCRLPVTDPAELAAQSDPD